MDVGFSGPDPGSQRDRVPSPCGPRAGRGDFLGQVSAPGSGDEDDLARRVSGVFVEHDGGRNTRGSGRESTWGPL